MGVVGASYDVEVHNILVCPSESGRLNGVNLILCTYRLRDVTYLYINNKHAAVFYRTPSALDARPNVLRSLRLYAVITNYYYFYIIKIIIIIHIITICYQGIDL